ncbi:uncharacterized protein LOC121242410 [Juglans microcarpa x Juglans regia]|uniref:uncharacterized protein LOC121242410 n=1 Tax=Juglans microcarpa x Juglans regia TaxID=2249226 RepID=UPI001B7EF22D|nr:uncharacterized protein LOC121242410 [Juglans microcarpa x Juglans regia]
MSNTDSNMQTNPTTNPHHPASPYFIQPGEGASSPLVPDLLNTENYVTWARTMRRALNIKNKLGFIDGTIVKPTSNSDPLYAPWERYTATHVWNDLRERFSIQNAPRIFQLSKSISSLTQEDDFVSQYYNKLKCFWDELEIYEPMPICTCGSVKTLLEYTHKNKVMQFLMGLNDSFDSIRAQILLHDPLPTLNRVLSIVQQEERRRQLHSPSTPLAMVTRGPDHRTTTSSRKDRLFCSYCNIPGHSLERCFKANPNLPVCSHCRIPGHIKEKCYKFNGFPPGHKNNSKSKSYANQSTLEQEQINNGPLITQEQYSQLLALLHPHPTPIIAPAANIASTSNLPMSGNSYCNSAHSQHTVTTIDTPWIIDTGATDHMICSSALFSHNITPISHTVKLPNGSTTQATHIGDVRLNACLILRNDLSSWTTIGLGTVTNGLYHLQISRPHLTALSSFFNAFPSSSVNNSNAYKFDDFTLWHYRFGHSSMTKHILKDILKDSSKATASSQNPCDICPIAKLHRLPFPTSELTANKPYDLISVDI